jgi:GAF domain-containing protein
VLQQGVFDVEDLRADPRFDNNPAVMGEHHFRFYAAAAIRDARGVPPGSLCVIDTKPRHLSALHSEASQRWPNKSLPKSC